MCIGTATTQTTYLAGEVKLNGFDTDVGRTSSHVCSRYEWCVRSRRGVCWRGRGVHRLKYLTSKSYATMARCS
jgi:hypothetical protein